jgi:pimeloyl-ACP methyl ester carboxylesterase
LKSFLRFPLQLRRTGKRHVQLSTEELVYARAGDGVVSGGALFRPLDGSSAAHVAVIWIHGSGVNFYYPSYVKIARELAKRGLPTIVGNTRMHDRGNIEAFREPTNVRGGSYWGITTEQVGDVAAWIQLARDRGYDRVVLVGHSAGATAVQIYMARTQDTHVEGLGLASGRFRPASGPPVDSTRLARAKELVAAGRGAEPVPSESVEVHEPSETAKRSLRNGNSPLDHLRFFS